MSPQVAALREAFVTLEEGTFVGAFIALASLETKRAHNYILVRGIHSYIFLHQKRLLFDSEVLDLVAPRSHATFQLSVSSATFFCKLTRSFRAGFPQG